MHAFVLSLLALSVMGANLRQAPQVDLLQPVELLSQLFGQAFTTTTQSLELQLLTMLYPDTATDVQAQLDTCEDKFLAGNTQALQTLNGDILGLGLACASEDPTAPVTKLVQDTLQIMASIAAPCDDLKVDLVGDIENLIAASIVQGVQFSGQWFGPLAQWTAASLTPLEGGVQYLQPVVQGVGSVAGAVGVSDETLGKANTDATASVGAWTTVLNDIAAGTLTQDDVRAALDSVLPLTNDFGAVYGDVANGAAAYANQGVTAICAFVAPLLEFLQPEPAQEQ